MAVNLETSTLVVQQYCNTIMCSVEESPTKSVEITTTCVVVVVVVVVHVLLLLAPIHTHVSIYSGIGVMKTLFLMYICSLPVRHCKFLANVVYDKPQIFQYCKHSVLL